MFHCVIKPYVRVPFFIYKTITKLQQLRSTWLQHATIRVEKVHTWEFPLECFLTVWDGVGKLLEQTDSVSVIVLAPIYC